MNPQDLLTEASATIQSLPSSYTQSLKGWSLTTDQSKSAYGRTIYSKKLISLSVPLLKVNPEHIEQVVLHEVAHALVGPGFGHSRIWKEVALTLGVVNPGSSLKGRMADPKWIGICPLGCRITRQRLTESVRLGRCASHECKLDWTQMH